MWRGTGTKVGQVKRKSEFTLRRKAMRGPVAKVGGVGEAGIERGSKVSGRGRWTKQVKKSGNRGSRYVGDIG